MRFIHILIIAQSIFLLHFCSNSKTQVIVPGNIIPGAYQLELVDSFVDSKKIGVVANQISKVNDKHVIDTFLQIGIDVVAIFTPEHGFELAADAGEDVADGKYKNSNIPIFSLYGKNKKLNEAMLRGIDKIIFDLQDVGVRFYTYISTLHYVMQSCAENHIQLIVLDRPNPNAHYIDGPVLDTNYRSFIGMHQVPIVYGMTIGEYAMMINGEGWLGHNLSCDLSVIPIQNYSHNLKYSLVDKPSPNLPNMKSVYLYPSTCLFEGTVMSEGRGTQLPFQLFGHPDYPDHSYSFTPVSIEGASLNPKFKNKVCYGVILDTVDAWSYAKKNGINLYYLLSAYHIMDLGEDFFIDYFDLLAGNSTLRQQIVSGLNVEQIKKTWKGDLAKFKKIRAKYLLYP